MSVFNFAESKLFKKQQQQQKNIPIINLDTVSQNSIKLQEQLKQEEELKKKRQIVFDTFKNESFQIPFFKDYYNNVNIWLQDNNNLLESIDETNNDISNNILDIKFNQIKNQTLPIITHINDNINEIINEFDILNNKYDTMKDNEDVIQTLLNEYYDIENKKIKTYIELKQKDLSARQQNDASYKVTIDDLENKKSKIEDINSTEYTNLVHDLDNNYKYIKHNKQNIQKLNQEIDKLNNKLENLTLTDNINLTLTKYFSNDDDTIKMKKKLLNTNKIVFDETNNLDIIDKYFNYKKEIYNNDIAIFNKIKSTIPKLKIQYNNEKQRLNKMNEESLKKEEQQTQMKKETYSVRILPKDKTTFETTSIDYEGKQNKNIITVKENKDNKVVLEIIPKLEDPNNNIYILYENMLKRGIPTDAVKSKMVRDGIDKSKIDEIISTFKFGGKKNRRTNKHSKKCRRQTKKRVHRN
jgi:hypothetical protein